MRVDSNAIGIDMPLLRREVSSEFMWEVDIRSIVNSPDSFIQVVCMSKSEHERTPQDDELVTRRVSVELGQQKGHHECSKGNLFTDWGKDKIANHNQYIVLLL